ncbi:MAG: AmmeMemoRadiSam system protein A [Gammaproteobacteria bacterium]|nr:AmmeMemoRadiSam system protein A [Gammaproteobacteria bacterium]
MHTEQGAILLGLARASIHAALGGPAANPAAADWLRERGACFVTLTQHDRLRGCIGTLEAHRPLMEDVRANAVAAAFHDPRFIPLTAPELPHTCIEISLLSRMEPLDFKDESDLHAQLRPHTDGVVLRYGAQRGTFLPQVWQHLPGTRDFLRELKQKAGLPADFWAQEIEVYRYTVRKWHERDSLAEAGTASGTL